MTSGKTRVLPDQLLLPKDIPAENATFIFLSINGNHMEQILFLAQTFTDIYLQTALEKNCRIYKYILRFLSMEKMSQTNLVLIQYMCVFSHWMLYCLYSAIQIN